MPLNPVRQKVYKVVYCNDKGELQSVGRSVRQYTLYGLTYPPNQVVRPVIGKIFAFCSLERAQEFQSGGGNAIEIWEAEGYGADGGLFRADLDGELTGKNIMNFWGSTTVERWAEPCPLGTVFCKAIKLLKKIR
jgi:hypothetical protein